MNTGASLWRWRYAAEDRRRLAAAAMRYHAEAGWCVVLILLGAGRWR